MAEAFDATLVVTSVRPLPDTAEPVDRAEFLHIALGGEDASDLMPDSRMAELDRAEELLQGRRVRTMLVPGIGDAADAILDVAENHDADLIVVGTGMPGALQRLLGMTVSGSVVRQADREVLVVP